MGAAHVAFERMARNGFAILPRDGRWTACLACLAEVCVALGDASRAAVLHRLLLPYSGRNLVLGNGSGCVGSADRLLGLLAATMAQWSDAERHFSEAIAMNERIGAIAPLAHSRRNYANMLLARGLPGDRERAVQLLKHVRNSATALGLAALVRKVEADLAAMASPLAAADELTAREAEVLDLISMGRTNADIALVLSIAVTTVATHVRNILAKTGCANRTEAAAHALRWRTPPQF